MIAIPNLATVLALKRTSFHANHKKRAKLSTTILFFCFLATKIKTEVMTSFIQIIVSFRVICQHCIYGFVVISEILKNIIIKAELPFLSHKHKITVQRFTFLRFKLLFFFTIEINGIIIKPLEEANMEFFAYLLKQNLLN